MNLKRSLSVSVYLEEVKYLCQCIDDCYKDIARYTRDLKILEKKHDDDKAQIEFGLNNVTEVAEAFDQGTIEHKEITQQDADEFRAMAYERLDAVRQVHRFTEYLINHSGVLASFLFPYNNKNNRKAKRGSLLRTITKTNFDSPLANRSLRNSYQHYDERLDSILEQSNSYDFRNVTSFYSEPMEAHMSFIYDPKTSKIFYPKRNGVNQEEFDLRKIVTETERIKTVSENVLRQIYDYSWEDGTEKANEFIDSLILENAGNESI